jgi:hypothetical protein
MAIYTLDTLETCHSPMDALGARIDMLAQMPAFLADVLSRCSDEALRHKPSVEGFSILEQICHLRDIEVDGYSARLDLILSQEKPLLPDIDGSRLAIERRYNEQDVGPAFMTFRAARELNLVRLRRLTEDELQRKALMDGVGEITLARLIAMWAAHDAGHWEELSKFV